MPEILIFPEWLVLLCLQHVTLENTATCYAHEWHESSLAKLQMSIFLSRSAIRIPYNPFSCGRTAPCHLHRVTSSTYKTPQSTLPKMAPNTLQEGLAHIITPENADPKRTTVFYNPIQQFNRDLSVLAILCYGEAALVENKAAFDKKGKSKGKSKQGRRNKAQAPREQGAEEEPTNPGKRKRVDDEEVDNPEGDAKRARQGLEPTDEEEELEIIEPESRITSHISSELADHNAQPSNPTQDEVQSESQTRLPPKPWPHEQFAILDALSASGLRALRYAKEIPFSTTIIANDLSSTAVKSIEANIDYNNVRDKVHSNVGDARAYMYSKSGDWSSSPSSSYVHKFDVIDLDPYGTAAPFFDSALQAIADGGLLCVTCTDAGVFASNGYPEKAYALYNGIPMKGPFSHEAGLRLILHAIATSGAKYGIAIEPLLSLSIDFYARLFIRVHKSQAATKLLPGTTMLTYSCDHGCGAWSMQPLLRNQTREDKNGNPFFKFAYAQLQGLTSSCEHCGSKMHLSGPLWGGPLHNPYFVQRMLDRLPDLDKRTYATTARIEGMLNLALEELFNISMSACEDKVSHTNGTTHGNKERDDNAELTPDISIMSAKTPVLPIPRMPPDTIDHSPFFFIPNYVAKVLHAITPSEDALRGALRHLGYRVTRSHCKPGSIKTDAPWTVIWDVFRAWLVQKPKPGKGDGIKPGTAGWAILSGPGRGTIGSQRRTVSDLQQEFEQSCRKETADIKTFKEKVQSLLWKVEQAEKVVNVSEANKRTDGTEDEVAGRGGEEASKSGPKQIIFDEALGREVNKKKLVRYQINPRADWGPMHKATGRSGGAAANGNRAGH